ncbi:MAG: glycosyltransferase [Pseudomonadales bacterium]|nr:glycosyltransferase [Pseudomonadales bacterium]
MKFFCATPCFNAEKYIEETMLSVLTQKSLHSNEHSLFYVIQDGESSDKTIAIAKNIAQKYTHRDNIEVKIISEKDTGMYDALSKAFCLNKGSEAFSYINAGDLYSQNAFEIVADIFTTQSVHFLTGLQTIYNEKGHTISSFLPFDIKKSLLLQGFYGSVLPHIQQESTFWSQDLQTRIDLSKLKEFKYAGDFFLWHSFIQHKPLFIVSAWLGGFKIHNNQMSDVFKQDYENEILSISDKKNISGKAFAYWIKLLSLLPQKIQKKFCKRRLEFDHSNQTYSGPDLKGSNA